MSGSGNSYDASDVQAQIEDDLIAQAEESGVDVESSVASVMDEYDDYGLSTVVRFAESELARKIDASAAESVTGILCGSRDRYGKNWPRRHALIRSNGDHIEVSSWSGSLQTSEGGEAEIPAGALVDMRLEYDEEYDSYEAKQLDSVRNLSIKQIADKLSEVAVHPTEIGRDDEYETVVVRGEARYINPQTVFEDGEPKGDGPIMLTDENENPKPHFELVLAEEGDTRLRAHVERQRYATPHFAIEDFEKLCKDAHSNFDTPDGQTGFVSDAMRGREVVVIGNVNKVDQSRSESGTTKYIDIGVAGIVEIPGDSAEQASPDADPEPEPETDGSDSSETDEAESEDDDSLRDFEPVEDPEDPDDSDDEESGADIEAVAEKVAQYASLVGMDGSEITVEIIRENTEIEGPDSVIEAAIGRLDGAGDADADVADENGDEPEDPDDMIESLRNSETGQIECPAEDCWFNCGSEAELYGHATGTHIPDDTNPEEWVEEAA